MVIVLWNSLPSQLFHSTWEDNCTETIMTLYKECSFKHIDKTWFQWKYFIWEKRIPEEVADNENCLSAVGMSPLRSARLLRAAAVWARVVSGYIYPASLPPTPASLRATQPSLPAAIHIVEAFLPLALLSLSPYMGMSLQNTTHMKMMWPLPWSAFRKTSTLNPAQSHLSVALLVVSGQ